MSILHSRGLAHGGNLKNFLFSTLNPYFVSVFRIILAISVLLVFWKGGGTLTAIIQTFPNSDNLYPGLFFTAPYPAFIFIILIAFCIGIRARITGLLLCILLLPLVFIEGYRFSRQIILFSLFAFSFIPSKAQYNIFTYQKNNVAETAPIWPIRLIQLQLSLLYGVNAIAKNHT